MLPSIFSLQGKVAIITGCGSETGIGWYSALQLGQLGASLVITSTTERIHDRVRELKEGGISQVVGVVADLTHKEETVRIVQTALEVFGAVDILVNNAGMVSVSSVMEVGSIFTMDTNIFQASIARNVETMFNMTKAAIGEIIKSKSGRVINISSTTGFINATRDDVGYATAKAAITGFTRATALDVARYGVTVNAIAPGWIQTASQTEFEAVQGQFTPIGRSGTPNEVAYLVAMLAGQGASYITGQIIVVDGGNSVNEARG